MFSIDQIIIFALMMVPVGAFSMLALAFTVFSIWGIICVISNCKCPLCEGGK